MGHEHRGHALLVVQTAQPAPQLGADVGVERAERLVEQQHLRLHGERTGERHPLTLTAGQLMRSLTGPFGQPDQLEQLVDAGADLVPFALADPQPEGDVLEHGHVRERGVVLEHEPDAPVLRAHSGHVLAGDPDHSPVGLLEAGDDPQERRFARAARPEQRGQRSLGDVERDVVERGEVAELLGDVLGLDPHPASSLLDPNKVISSNTATEITANSVASAYTLVVT